MSGQPVVGSAPANTNTYTFPSASPNVIPATTTPIYFVVRATNSYGSSLGASSTAKAFVSVSAPTSPTNISAVLTRLTNSRTPYGITVTWKDSPNDAGYFLKRLTVGNRVATTSAMFPLSKDTVSYLDKSVISGQSYFYQLQAVNGSLMSDVISSLIVIIPSVFVSRLQISAPVL